MRFIVSLLVLLGLPLAFAAPQQAGADSAKKSIRKSAAASPKTAWGDPDLQGVYTFAAETPLQRPTALGDKTTYTEAELQEMERKAKAKAQDNVATNEHFSYNALWFNADAGKPTGRTSLIVDPPNGRMPPLTERGERLRKEYLAGIAAKRLGKQEMTDTWEDHTTYDQCIARPMPRVNQEYNQGVEILQSPGFVTIFYESMHDARIIPVDGRPHLDSSVRLWNGDSVGHWEGNTLVVDTTNFTDKQKSDGSTPFGGFPQGNLRLTERFTRTDTNTVNYEVTVTDLEVWTRPFTFVLPWRSGDSSYKGPEDLLEYACHEGNYRMIEDTITGTRALRKAEAAKK
jgi:hypothetical protein